MVTISVQLTPGTVYVHLVSFVCGTVSPCFVFIYINIAVCRWGKSPWVINKISFKVRREIVKLSDKYIYLPVMRTSLVSTFYKHFRREILKRGC